MELLHCSLDITGHELRHDIDRAGNRLRVGSLALDVSDDRRNVSHRLRYERIAASGEVESVERTWEKRFWRQPQFLELARAAGFDKLTFRAPDGGPAEPDARVFVALAQRT